MMFYLGFQTKIFFQSGFHFGSTEFLNNDFIVIFLETFLNCFDPLFLLWFQFVTVMLCNAKWSKTQTQLY